MVLAIVPPQDFLAFGGVQATIEAEAREQAEALAATAAEAVSQEANVTPKILVKSGKPAEVVREVIGASDEVAALVLATAASGAPGPLRSEAHTSELQSLMRISYAVCCLKKKKKNHN